jgi:hypothetical protein
MRAAPHHSVDTECLMPIVDFAEVRKAVSHEKQH